MVNLRIGIGTGCNIYKELIAHVSESKIKILILNYCVVDNLQFIMANKRFLKNVEPDRLVMRIQLSDGVTFELLEHFKLNCPIVFTTAYDEFAIRAFKVNGVDYLLKPVDEDELTRAIDKCKAIIERRNPIATDFTELMKELANPQQGLDKDKERFIVKIRNQWMPIATNDIVCFAKETLNYIYLFNSERYMLDFSTLEDVGELLDSNQFYRANRQYIINIDAIQTVKPIENSKLTIKLKEPNHKYESDMSREKAPVFKKWIDK